MMTKITSKADHVQLVIAPGMERIRKPGSAVAPSWAVLRTTGKSGSDLGIDSFAKRCLAFDPS
jgi:hypothetical protein